MDEITAEYSVAELVEPAQLKARVKVSVACKTDLGRVRENNEDKFEYYIPEDDAMLATKGMIFVVCDGMGGHAAGQIASELACKTFIDVYLNHPSSSPEAALEAGVVAANRFVFDCGTVVPSRRGMGTTLTAIVLLQGDCYSVQVGDSRAYRLRDGELQQITAEHTWIDEAIRAGWVTEEEAASHPNRHMLLRAIGVDQTVQCDVVKHDLQTGDIFALCSDGLTNHVSDSALLATLSSNGLSEAVWKLVGAALMDGGSDNCTVVCVRVDAIDAA